MIGIYKITNKSNGKVYIGQTNDIERRLNEHKQKRTVTIDDYINCLGVDAFTYEVLEECSEEELDEKEQLYIQQYDSKNHGYNCQNGGCNNSRGEGNGRAKLTEQDIYFIRQSYAEHTSPSAIYEKYFKDKITKSSFQAIWQGKSWSYIMPEVYTEENKKYYTSTQQQLRATLDTEEVLKYRKYYVDHTREEVYEKFFEEHGTLLKKATFFKILIGDVNPNSIYLTIPVYKKALKRWELNKEPVSTIP